MKKKLLITGFLAATLSLAPLLPASASDHNVTAKFASAFNKYLITDYNVGVKDQNSSNNAICRRGIYLENAAYKNFDNVLASLSLPKKDRALVQTVLTDNTVLQSLNATLAANVDNVSNYNSLFPSVTSARATFTAALTSLASKLGVKFRS